MVVAASPFGIRCPQPLLHLGGVRDGAVEGLVGFGVRCPLGPTILVPLSVPGEAVASVAFWAFVLWLFPRLGGGWLHHHRGVLEAPFGVRGRCSPSSVWSEVVPFFELMRAGFAGGGWRRWPFRWCRSGCVPHRCAFLVVKVPFMAGRSCGDFNEFDCTKRSSIGLCWWLSDPPLRLHPSSVSGDAAATNRVVADLCWWKISSGLCCSCPISGCFFCLSV